jgi:hypothetical protein
MNDKTTREKTDQWPTNVIAFIWMEAHQMWKHRCDFVHRKTEQLASAQDQLRAHAKVRAIYAYSDKIGYLDRRIFAISLEDRLKHTPRELFAWVTSIQPAVMTARKSYQQRAKESNQDIREFFKPSVTISMSVRNSASEGTTQNQSSTGGDNNNPI